MSDEVTDVDPVGESKDWAAWEDHQPTGPVSFHVRGTVVVIATNYAARLEKKEPRGINPKNLLLNLVVTRTGEIGGDVITELSVQYTEDESYEADNYESVTILRDGNGGAHIPEVESEGLA